MRNFSRRILLALAILVLSISTLGGTVVNALADFITIEPTQKPANIYTEETYISYDSEMEYAIPVRMSYYGECIASYQIGIDVPDFLTVVDVTCDNFYEETTSFIVEKTLGGFRVSFTTQYEAFSGDAVLFNVICKTNRPGEYWGEFMISGDFTTMFVSETAREIPYICEFSGIGVSSEGFDSVITGDLNLDGVVTLADVICLQRYILGNCDGMPSNIFNAGDIDKNGNIDSIDVQYMQMYLVNAIPSLDDIGGNNGDNDDSGSTGDDYKDPLYLSVSILDSREQLITYQTFTAEKGTLYPAVVGDYVAEFLNRYSANVARIQSDAYGEMTTEQAEKAVLEISDCVFVYLDVVIDDYNEPQRNIVQDTYIEVETNYRVRFVLYDDYTLEMYDNGELIEKGKYFINENQYDITAVLSNGYKFRATYNKFEDCYYVSGGDNETPSGYVRAEIYYVCYMGATGQFVTVDYCDVTTPEDTTVYDFVRSENSYGDLVEIISVYSDENRTTIVSQDELVINNGVYYVEIADVALTGTYNLVRESYNMNGMTSLEILGTVTFNNDQATIVYNGEMAGQSYFFVCSLGTVEIKTGEYSQIMVEIEDNNAIIFYEFDGSDYKVQEEFMAVEGWYSLEIPGADMPMGINLFANGISYIGISGDVRMLMPYQVDGDVVTLTMYGSSINATVDRESQKLIVVGGSGGDNPSDREIYKTAPLSMDGKIGELVLYTDSSFVIIYNGENAGEGNYKESPSGQIELFDTSSFVIIIEFDYEKNYYYVVGSSGGVPTDPPTQGETTTFNVLCYYEMNGQLVEVGGGNVGVYDAENTGVYSFASAYHHYGETVLVDAIYYDKDFTQLVPTDACFIAGMQYFVVLKDVEIVDATFILYQQRVTTTGKPMLEEVGTLKVTETDATIFYNGETAGTSYPYGIMLGQMEIRTGEYSQILVAISGDQAIIAWEYDGSMNEVNEVFTKYAGVYEMSAFSAPFPYVITLCPNGVVKINAGGDINIMDTYFLEGDQITFSMMGNVIKGTVDIDNKVIICDNGGNNGDNSGSGSVVDKGLKEIITLYDKDLGICDLRLYTDHSFEIFTNEICVAVGGYSYLPEDGYALYIADGDILFISYDIDMGYYIIDNIENHPERELIESSYLFADSLEAYDINFYTDCYFEVYYHDSFIIDGYFYYMEDGNIYLKCNGGNNIRIAYDSETDSYYGLVSEDPDDPNSNYVSIHYIVFYQTNDGEYIAMNEGGGEFPRDTLVYDYMLRTNEFGSAVIVTGIYYDRSLKERVDEKAVFENGRIYYIVVTDANIDGTYALGEESYNDNGETIFTQCGVISFENGMATITSNGVQEVYPYNIMCGEIEIVMGEYAQMILSINNDVVVIESRFDASNNSITEEFSAVAGNYLFNIDEYGFSYNVTLYNNGVCRLNQGNIGYLAFYSVIEGSELELNIFGTLLTVKIEGEELIYVSGFDDYYPDGDYDEEISPQFVAMMEIDGEYYPVTEWSAKCTYASTIGEYVEYLEKQMSGLKVLAMYTVDGTILDNSAPYDVNAYYIGMVTNCELYGKFTLILEENGKQKVGFIEFSEDGVIYTDMNGNGGVYEYTQFLNNIEIKLGEFSQICITIAGEYAYLEYTFDGSDCVEDETLNYLVGSYGLEDIFETPMKLIIYNNGICRMVQTCCDVGMYFRYSITEKGIAIDAYGEVTEFEYDAKTNTYVCVKNYGDDYNSGSDNGYIESGKNEGYVESDLENLVGEIGGVNYN